MARVKKKYETDERAAADLADALQHLPEQWVMCRDMRHAWRVMNDFHVTKSDRRIAQEIRRELVCMRCETVRVEAYHQSRFGLEKVAQGYRYPEHYQIKGVPRGVKPQSIVQQEQFRRAMERIANSAKAEKKGA